MNDEGGGGGGGMVELKKFGTYLCQLRKAKNLTQSELADKLNVTRQSVSKWELGDSFPDISLLTKISEIFGVSVDTLISAGEPESQLDALTEAFANHGINIKPIADLVLYMNDSSPAGIIERRLFNDINEAMLSKLIPFLDEESLEIIFRKILDKELSASLLPALMPHIDRSLVEIAVIDGQLEFDVLRQTAK
jgi:transcriptional regulator with XRE-family HTH domain